MPAEPISTAATTAALTGAVGIGAAIGVSMIDSASMSMFGVPAIVPFFAFLGAMAALVYGEPVKPWYRLLLVMSMNVILGIVGALALQYVPGFAWTVDIPSQIKAFFIAGLALWFMPALATHARPGFAGLVERVFGSQPPASKE